MTLAMVKKNKKKKIYIIEYIAGDMRAGQGSKNGFSWNIAGTKQTGVTGTVTGPDGKLFLQ